MGISLEAIETIEFGYKFAVMDDLDCVQNELFEELLRKVKIGLSRQYIKKGKFPNGREYNSMVSDEIAGRIEYDENREGIPLINIDGKPYTWDEIGKMLMTNEGFQFKLKVFDITDDVD